MHEQKIGPTHLCDLARQVRESTLNLLASADESDLYWAPAGPSNHIVWHAGHALWLQDRLCLEVLTEKTELPKGWKEKFGMNCRPVASTKSWPSRDELAGLLTRQLERIHDVVNQTPIERLIIPHSDGRHVRCPAGQIIHGFHDEARHQGEMYLLLKLARER
jgi:hypothetical protein